MNKVISSMLFVFLINPPAFAKISYHRSYDSQAVCNDGSYSSSRGSGSCSNHGGIDYYL